MEQLCILVVDDNRINRLYLKTILTQWQHHVTEADSGQSALSACHEQSFDLILMDIRMQPMDGVTAAAKIKQLSQHKNTPIVAVSAEKFDCQDYPQFKDGLTKPLTKTALESLITQQSTIRQKPPLNDNNPFDENRALAISHHDADIVNKLRTLFINELAKEIEKVEHHHQAKLWQKLDNQLHYLQGSARVCAAHVLNQHITNYRQHLADKSFDNLDTCLAQVKQAAAHILAGTHNNAL